MGCFFSGFIESHPQIKLSGCDPGYLVDHMSVRIMASSKHRSSEGESSAESDDVCQITLPLSVSKCVVAGDPMLKSNRKSKGSRAWDQFCIVWDPDKNQEVYGIACCSVCKLCLLYKKLVNGEEKLMSTMNILDHLKNCVPSLYSNHAAVAGTDTDSSSGSSTNTVVRRVSGIKTLVSFVKRSGKKVGGKTKMFICERTAALVAAAHLPYYFVKLESLKNLLRCS